MAEISKEAKIVFLINVIVSLIFGFFFFGIPEIYYDLFGGVAFSAVCWRQIGGTVLIIGLFGIISLIRKEWEQVRIFWEFGIAFLIILIIIDLWFGIGVYGAFDITFIVEIVLVVINIFFYIRERK
ncbi:MAG: hypothetical protein ACFE85_03045 [Candidatus Hodarchaeota archaeon]